MTDTTDTDLAQALRKLHQRWLDLSTACISPSYALEECASEVEAILALHDTARAQPASVADNCVLVALHRPEEGYGDVHPELVAEDAIRQGWHYDVLTAPQPAKENGE
jgi:hypothetical protein